jgi:hypothetical protein
MRYSFFSRVALLSAFLVNGVLAADEIAETKDVRLSGYCLWDFGQIVSGKGGINFPEFDIPYPNPRQWTNNVLIGLRFEAQPSDRLHLNVSPEFNLNYPYPEMPTSHPESKRPFGGASINEAKGVFSFGDIEKPILQATLGMFVYKYNPDARHFGDYLFRTGTFPTYIITNFDFPAARLLGLDLSGDAIPNLHWDLMLTSEAFVYPLYDFSLSAIATYRIMNGIEIGAGVDFARLLPADPNKTSPHYNASDQAGFYNNYMTSNGDTANYYSFKATKVMGRVSIDPKSLLPLPQIFGKEDLKLYAELVAVGIGGYDAVDTIVGGVHYFDYYNDLSARTPIVLGFNIPAFKMLEVLSMELEYFPSLLPNDYYEELYNRSPIPEISKSSYDPKTFDKSGWLRWSFYARKQVLNGFYMAGLMAFDHLRTTNWDGSSQTYDFMATKGNWHWELKIGYNF